MSISLTLFNPANSVKVRTAVRWILTEIGYHTLLLGIHRYPMTSATYIWLEVHVFFTHIVIALSRSQFKFSKFSNNENWSVSYLVIIEVSTTFIDAKVTGKIFVKYAFSAKIRFLHVHSNLQNRKVLFAYIVYFHGIA